MFEIIEQIYDLLRANAYSFMGHSAPPLTVNGEDERTSFTSTSYPTAEPPLLAIT
jgi:hypothetical protein